jgi:hypothetical protein
MTHSPDLTCAQRATLASVHDRKWLGAGAGWQGSVGRGEGGGILGDCAAALLHASNALESRRVAARGDRDTLRADGARV